MKSGFLAATPPSPVGQTVGDGRVLRHPDKILAVVSDVDGTLVNDRKILTDRCRRAVEQLRERGIAFAIVSSRPPRGMAALIKPLGLTTPMAGFNGGLLVTPQLIPLEEHLLAADAARRTVATLTTHGADVWVFTGQDWLVRDRNGVNVDREIMTVGFEPIVVKDFGQALDATAKIVGVSDDPDLLSRCQSDLDAQLSGHANIVRSQRYYLDITHPMANKGAALLAIAKQLRIPPAAIAVIGDGANDMAMFGPSGLSIAMGNAEPQVQSAADHVTGRNDDEGFAQAMEQFILNRSNPGGGDEPSSSTGDLP